MHELWTFFGTLAGSAIGLIAILCGALYNARLNRERDDRLQAADRETLASALTAELQIMKETLTWNALQLEDVIRAPVDFQLSDPAHSIQIFPQVLAKIGLLGPDTIGRVTEAYLLIEQYAENLIMLGGKPVNMPAERRVFMMPASKAEVLAKLNRKRAEALDQAISKLDRYLPSRERL